MQLLLIEGFHRKVDRLREFEDFPEINLNPGEIFLITKSSTADCFDYIDGYED